MFILLSKCNARINMSKEEYNKSIESFITVCKSFDYVPSLENIVIPEPDDMLNDLKGHVLNFITIQTRPKLKNNDFKFLNDIVLFNGKLKLDVFKAENKNTKKSIVKYLSNIYLSTMPLSKKSSSQDLVLFMTMSNLHKIPKEEASTSGLGLGAGITDLNKILNDNPEVSNIAKKIMNQFQEEKINPMNLLTEMNSGNSDTLNNLVESIKSDMENLDKSKLEDTSKQLMTKIQSLIPGMDISGMINKLQPESLD